MSESCISIDQAAANGIERLRLPKWTTSEDHIKIDILDGRAGPWVKLFAPFNLECNGRDPVSMLITQFDTKAQEWFAYNGPLPASEEYQAKVRSYAQPLLKEGE